MAPSIVPRDVLYIENLEKFKSHKVIVRVLVLLRDGVCNERLNIWNLLLVCQLYSRLISHRTRAHLIPNGRLCRECSAMAPLNTIVEAVGVLGAPILVGAQKLLAFALCHDVSVGLLLITVRSIWAGLVVGRIRTHARLALSLLLLHLKGQS